MSDQAVVVYISVAGGEVEDLQDLIDGKEVELDWIGSLNGQDVPIKVRISDDPDDDLDDIPAELTTPLQRERYQALIDGGVDHDLALRDARKW